MAKRIKTSDLLRKINNISMEASDIEDEESDQEDIETVYSGNNDEFDEFEDHEEVRESSDISSSEEEKENINKKNEIAADGTNWEKIQEGSTTGRLPLHNIFKDISGPTGYAKRNIIKGEVDSAFLLLIDRNILDYIISCTELEAFRVLGKKWTLSETKIKAFIAILYAREAYKANNLNLSYLWDKEWGPNFFSKTMSRNNFS
ncbi:uncharacterized protein LOC122513544 [Polistes fuscatus]|uniref:uncharacterized protein LOC122513544 n=1 Tax=Polistes fuscatus TaxID=30207 RepID=UPI001CAA0409|nr:uncharacterized protein LOC122513544 [Polistes fuscatus]